MDFFARFLPLVGEVDLRRWGDPSLLLEPSRSVGRLWAERGLWEGGVFPVEDIHGEKFESRFEAKTLLRLLSTCSPHKILSAEEEGLDV